MSKPSATKVASRTIDSLFDIPICELKSIIENALRTDPITSLNIRIEHESTGNGMSSDAFLPTFSYQTESGISGELTCFVKRQLQTSHREAPHYLTAEKVGIPTPTYFGHWIGPKQEEILFLEFLPECGIDLQSREEVLAMVNLIACINTAPLRSAEFEITAPASTKQQVDEMNQGAERELKPKLAQVWQSGLAGEIGTEVQQLCTKHPQAIELLMRYLAYLHAQIVTLPKDALIQGDTGPHQMGWRIRENKRELVVFDLDWCIGRRFHDIGYILHNYLGDCSLSVETIATHYLTAYHEWGGAETPLHEFLEATRWLADEDKFWSCPWLWETARKQLVGGDPHIDANPTNFPAWLYQTLEELLQAAIDHKTS